MCRLQRHGVNIGGRWAEIADKAELRSADCLSAFNLPHWLMALVATGRFLAATQMVDGIREFSATAIGLAGSVLCEAALPISEAKLAHARGDRTGAIKVMRPALGVMHRLGGSHA